MNMYTNNNTNSNTNINLTFMTSPQVDDLNFSFVNSDSFSLNFQALDQ